jgi:hypothetical protein
MAVLMLVLLRVVLVARFIISSRRMLLAIQILAVWIRLWRDGRRTLFRCGRRCRSRAWGTRLEHGRVFDEGLRHSVTRIIRGSVILVLRVRIVVRQRGRIALLRTLSCLRLRLCTSLGRRRMLLARLRVSRWKCRARGWLLLCVGQTFHIIMTQNIPVPKARGLLAV